MMYGFKYPHKDQELKGALKLDLYNITNYITE